MTQNRTSPYDTRAMHKLINDKAPKEVKSQSSNNKELLELSREVKRLDCKNDDLKDQLEKIQIKLKELENNHDILSDNFHEHSTDCCGPHGY